MPPLKELLRRLRFLLHPRTFNTDLADELQFHIETRADELESSGVPRSEALSQARREFGPAARTMEDTRAAWQFRWLADLIADLRYGIRALRRQPGFALAATLSLALGIGANTTIFSLTMEALFSEPSCRRPETLVNVRLGGNSHSPMREYRFIRDARTFEGLAGEREESEVNWRNGDQTRRLFAMHVTDNFFEVTGVPVFMGRPIQTGEKDVVVVAWRFWRSWLGGDSNTLGHVLVLDGRPHTIVGVLPRDHRTLVGFGFSPDLFLPVSDEKTIVAFFARLPEGMRREEARSRLESAARELDRVYPQETGWKWAENVEVNAVSGMDRLRGPAFLPVAAFFAMLLALVGLVLLIACANVASLLLARASSRSQELAIRLSIGASRNRIVRQLLAESFLLAALGTCAGLALNLALTGMMSRIALPLPIPIQLQIEPDWRLLIYSVAIAFACALLCGLMPALKATRANVNSVLKTEERQTGGGRWNLRNALVVGQLAVSILLLAVGSLFLRNLMKSTSMSPGFDVDHTLWSYMRLVPEKYAQPERGATLINAAMDRLHAIPGVESAAIARTVPLNDISRTGSNVRTDLSDNPIHVQYTSNWVGPEYFKTMAIPILSGREFSSADRTGSPEVVILNETFARQCFGAVNPVGHTLRWGKDPPVTIVGLAKNSKYWTLGESNVMALYTPYMQQLPAGFRVNLHFLIRASGSPAALRRSIDETLGKLDQAAAIETKPMRDALLFAFLPSRAGAALLGGIGILGLLLATVGLYGVLVYAVARRVREIGIRMALGAAPHAILKMILRDSFALVGIGMTLGLAIAAIATRPLATFLVPELSATDPTAFASVIAVLLTAALAATIGPALRALRVDPMIALRYE
jgi:predicted permease